MDCTLGGRQISKQLKLYFGLNISQIVYAVVLCGLLYNIYVQPLQGAVQHNNECVTALHLHHSYCSFAHSGLHRSTLLAPK